MTQQTLTELNAAVKRDMELLAYPSADWVAQEDGVLDCAIIGGGQMGLSVAFGLRREKVMNIKVFDANPAGREGPWVTYARMETLRTPKVYSGPENSFANLSFQAWFEAAYGLEAWDRLTRIPRIYWMEYLVWFRTALELPVVNEATVSTVKPEGDSLFRLTVTTPKGTEIVKSRTVVYATGAFGSGRDYVPENIVALPNDKWRHANAHFDHEIFRGKRVGVLGAGASAFDCAATAMENGAISTDLCFRRAEFPAQNPRRFLETAGFLGRYRSMPDDLKWKCVKHLYDIGQPPPAPTYARAMSQNVKLRPSTPWLGASVNETGAVVIETGSETLEYDFLVAATGVVFDLSMRPELSNIADDIALWKDRFTPAKGDEHATLLNHPYQSEHGQLIAKDETKAPWMKRVFMLNGASGLSLGPTIHSCAALRYATPMIVSGVADVLHNDSAAATMDYLVNNVFYEQGLDDLLHPKEEEVV